MARCAVETLCWYNALKVTDGQGGPPTGGVIAPANRGRLGEKIVPMKERSRPFGDVFLHRVGVGAYP